MDFNHSFTVTSIDLPGQITDKQLGNAFGCSGQNYSPQLTWKNAPKSTKAFAITMYDQDAPTGSGFWHWVVYNIPNSENSIEANSGTTSENKLPAGAEHGTNDAGIRGYVGPCPQPNTLHTYLITVYALKSPIVVDDSACAAWIGFMLNANVITKASLVAYGQG
ncbi:YbhB/YbcL family Raf kinase inhibitor-like protein [Aquimarina pacifica]|uniref:YbhB/YbcL family Raf kinase inhibitor-like protein n=1 Tax=Aquimarina pacifica TaxID=1296415 RepID=UPI000472F9E9|nr:YbhB/YbcL family Raf kinase inhibitor-like protein [Aquimarina pacifica]